MNCSTAPKTRAAIEEFGDAMERRFNLASIGLGSKIENAAYQRVIAAKTKP
ncbi:MAG: hypothetical protein ABL933_17190 [Methyloglobulus sp.]|nr:hypothetical protein [Methyloglobulus sp.]